MSNPPQQKIFLSVGAKLTLLLAVVLVGAELALMFLSSRLYIADQSALIQQMNLDTSSNLALQTRRYFENVSVRLAVIGDVLRAEKASDSDSSHEVSHGILERERDFVGVFLYEVSDNGYLLRRSAVSRGWTKQGDKKGEKLIRLLKNEKDFVWEQLERGESQMVTLKTGDSVPLLTFGIPYLATGEKSSNKTKITHVLIGFFNFAPLKEVFSENELFTSYLVTKRGKALAFADALPFSIGEDLSARGIVSNFLEGKINNGVSTYFDTYSREKKLAAFNLVGVAGLGVFVEVPEGKAYRASKRVEFRGMALAAVILGLAFLIGHLYSKSIVGPLKALGDAANRVGQGDFKASIIVKGYDELGQLGRAFNHMLAGLEERDRVKSLFSKFHSREIAEKIMNGGTALGGDQHNAVILFTDLRGFTSLAEKYPAAEIVKWLNEYFARMVAVIQGHGGIVDKFVGDAIMAVWGVPHERNDITFDALRACLSMRLELTKLNELRVRRGEPELWIGMGLHEGQVIAGNVGTDDRMEFTVIGDTVNTAARTESKAKEFGTDLVVTESVYHHMRDKFVFEPCGTSKVKGKETAVEFYKVLGFVSPSTGKPVLIKTKYSDLSESVATEKAA